MTCTVIAKGGTTAPTTLNKQYCANYIEKYQKPINAEIHQRSIKSKQELQVTDPQQINSDRSGSEHATLEGLVLCGARTRQRQRAFKDASSTLIFKYSPRRSTSRLASSTSYFYSYLSHIAPSSEGGCQSSAKLRSTDSVNPRSKLKQAPR